MAVRATPRVYDVYVGKNDGTWCETRECKGTSVPRVINKVRKELIEEGLEKGTFEFYGVIPAAKEGSEDPNWPTLRDTTGE